MNSYDIEANYGQAFFDARHVVSAAGSYELPFGKDRKFGSSWNRALDAASRRLGPQLRAHGSHRLSDHGDRQRRLVAAGDTWLRSVRTGSAAGKSTIPR